MHHATDTVYFGKYRTNGLTFNDLMARDPGYLCWLRSEKGRGAFSDELNAALDKAINEKKSLKEWWFTTNLEFKPRPKPPSPTPSKGITPKGVSASDGKDAIRRAMAANHIVKSEAEVRQEAYGDNWGGF